MSSVQFKVLAPISGRPCYAVDGPEGSVEWRGVGRPARHLHYPLAVYGEDEEGTTCERIGDQPCWPDSGSLESRSLAAYKEGDLDEIEQFMRDEYDVLASTVASRRAELASDKSMAGFVVRHQITVDVSQGDPSPFWGDQEHYSYSVTLRRPGGHELVTPFHTGIAWTREPNAEDVLDSLASDAGTWDNANGFRDWCSDLGMDPDQEDEDGHNNAARLYRATEEQRDHLVSFLDADQYQELLYEIERL